MASACFDALTTVALIKMLTGRRVQSTSVSQNLLVGNLICFPEYEASIIVPKNPPDFRAAVSFLPVEMGGRQEPPLQGIYRPDIRYPADTGAQAWMVWPLFLSTDESEMEHGAAVPLQCSAHFYIVDESLRREVHASRLKVGVRFDLVKGSKRVAVCEVTKLLSLHDNFG